MSSPTTPPDCLARYCPHRPWPKQQAFLDLECLEAFYGGAAAGGKSEALLMAALQYVHVPGYAALILRRDTRRLRLAGGLIPRSHQWLTGGEARWREADLCWTFPTAGMPATLRFGYLMNSHDMYRYGSSEFQYIAFDELTEFPKDDYLFLFSRLRRTTVVAAPLRMRSASNPGNLGHDWVRQRFIPDDLRTGSAADVVFKRGAAYVPARIGDNPAVDATEYRRSLLHLSPLVRERLMNGDWSVREEGLFQAEWLRYYLQQDHRIVLQDAGQGAIGQYDDRQAHRIATVDPAGTSADRAREQRGKPPSWTVIEIWEIPPAELCHFRVLRDVWRQRVGFDGLCQAIERMHRQWQPTTIGIENERLGQAAVDLLSGRLPLRTVATGGRDKVTRAAPLISRMQRGEVFLPRYETRWRCQFEAELLAWTGLPEETCDQIDAAAYAMGHEFDGSGSALRIEPIFWRP